MLVLLPLSLSLSLSVALSLCRSLSLSLSLLLSFILFICACFLLHMYFVFDNLVSSGSKPICNIATQPFRGCFEMIANRDIEVAEQVVADQLKF